MSRKQTTSRTNSEINTRSQSGSITKYLKTEPEVKNESATTYSSQSSGQACSYCTGYSVRKVQPKLEQSTSGTQSPHSQKAPRKNTAAPEYSQSVTPKKRKRNPSKIKPPPSPNIVEAFAKVFKKAQEREAKPSSFLDDPDIQILASFPYGEDKGRGESPATSHPSPDITVITIPDDQVQDLEALNNVEMDGYRHYGRRGCPEPRVRHRDDGGGHGQSLGWKQRMNYLQEPVFRNSPFQPQQNRIPQSQDRLNTRFQNQESSRVSVRSPSQPHGSFSHGVHPGGQMYRNMNQGYDGHPTPHRGFQSTPQPSMHHQGLGHRPNRESPQNRYENIRKRGQTERHTWTPSQDWQPPKSPIERKDSRAGNITRREGGSVSNVIKNKNCTPARDRSQGQCHEIRKLLQSSATSTHRVSMQETGDVQMQQDKPVTPGSKSEIGGETAEQETNIVQLQQDKPEAPGPKSGIGEGERAKQETNIVQMQQDKPEAPGSKSEIGGETAEQEINIVQMQQDKPEAPEPKSGIGEGERAKQETNIVQMQQDKPEAPEPKSAIGEGERAKQGTNIVQMQQDKPEAPGPKSGIGEGERAEQGTNIVQMQQDKPEAPGPKSGIGEGERAKQGTNIVQMQQDKPEAPGPKSGIGEGERAEQGTNIVQMQQDKPEAPGPKSGIGEGERAKQGTNIVQMQQDKPEAPGPKSGIGEGERAKQETNIVQMQQDKPEAPGPKSGIGEGERAKQGTNIVQMQQDKPEAPGPKSGKEEIEKTEQTSSPSQRAIHSPSQCKQSSASFPEDSPSREAKLLHLANTMRVTEDMKKQLILKLGNSPTLKGLFKSQDVNGQHSLPNNPFEIEDQSRQPIQDPTTGSPTLKTASRRLLPFTAEASADSGKDNSSAAEQSSPKHESNTIPVDEPHSTLSTTLHNLMMKENSSEEDQIPIADSVAMETCDLTFPIVSEKKEAPVEDIRLLLDELPEETEDKSPEKTGNEATWKDVESTSLDSKVAVDGTENNNEEDVNDTEVKTCPEIREVTAGKDERWAIGEPALSSSDEAGPSGSQSTSDPENHDKEHCSFLSSFQDDSMLCMDLDLSSNESDDDDLMVMPTALKVTSSSARAASIFSPKPPVSPTWEKFNSKPGTVRERHTTKSSNKFSLDALLAERRQREVQDKELEAMKAELKDGPGIREMAEVNPGEELLPEHVLKLKKLQVTEPAIRDFHPGQVILDSERFCCLFSYPTSLTLASCGFVPGSSYIDKHLSTLPPDLLAELLTTNTVEICFNAISTPHAFLSWLYQLMSIHTNSQVVHHTYSILYHVLLRNAGSAADWVPSIRDITRIFVNYGANLNDLCPEKSLLQLTPDDLQTPDNKENGEECQPDQPLEDAPEDRPVAGPCRIENMKFVIQTIAEATARRPERYKVDELTALVIMMLQIALDKTLNQNILKFDITICLSSILSAFPEDKWQAKVVQLCHILPTLTDHHHNQAYMVTLLPPGSRGRYLQCRLAYAMLQQILFDATDFDDLVDFKVRQLFNVVSSIKVKGEDVDYYLVSSLIMLLDNGVGKEMLHLSEKSDLSMLIEMLRDIMGDVRESINVLDRTVVKDQMVRLHSRWSFMLQNMGITQTTMELFAPLR